MIPEWLRDSMREAERSGEARQEMVDAREEIRQSVTPEILKLLDAFGWPKLKPGTKRRRLVSSKEKRDRVRLEMLKSGELK
jgi:hypothetical protein